MKSDKWDTYDIVTSNDDLIIKDKVAKAQKKESTLNIGQVGYWGGSEDFQRGVHKGVCEENNRDGQKFLVFTKCFIMLYHHIVGRSC